MARDPHWFVYAWGAYGFYHMKKWMWPWAGVYVLQIAFSMVVWQLRTTAERVLFRGWWSSGSSQHWQWYCSVGQRHSIRDLTTKHPLLF